MFGTEREPSTNEKEDEMTVTKEQFDALSAEVKTLSEGLSKIGETITNAVATAVKPITDAQAELVANQKAKDEAEHAELVTKIVNAKVLDEATAKATPLATLRALAPQADPKKSVGLNSAFNGGGEKSAPKAPEGE